METILSAKQTRSDLIKLFVEITSDIKKNLL